MVDSHPGTDAKVAATRICQGYGILNWHCVDALTAQITEALKAACPLSLPLDGLRGSLQSLTRPR